MALTWSSLWITALINLVITAVYVLLYSIFSVQRVNSRIYFVRWFVLDEEDAKKKYEGIGSGALELNPLHYLHAFNWICDSLRFNQDELVQHAGLDMVVYLRMFVMAWKVFVPITVVSCAVLIPIYITTGYLGTISSDSFVSSSLNSLTIANLPPQSNLMWVLVVLAYIFNAWILFVMAHEFKVVSEMRVKYTASLPDKPNQYTVLVRQVPCETSDQTPENTEKFFQEMHPFTYLLNQATYRVGNLSKLVPKLEYKENRLEALKIRSEKSGKRPKASKGFCGPKVDAIDLQEDKIKELKAEIATKQETVLTDPKAIMPACFVSFSNRRGAAVAAQTLQASDPAQWITTWAPEPQDVCWTNLDIPFMQLGMRKILIAFATGAVVTLFMIPVGLVQSFCNLQTIQTYAEKLHIDIQPVLNIAFVNAFLQGFLPGLALSIFLMVLPPILLAFSKLEGYVAYSEIDRAAAGKNFYFKIVIVFLANVILGALLTNLAYYISNPSALVNALGTAIPQQYTFFITFTMVNGWAGTAIEIFRGFGTIVIFHLKTWLLCVTDEDRVKAMSPPNPGWFALIPEMEMYFLFSFMFMVICPFYLPFVLVFYVWGYLIYRNQFINVYSNAYDLRGGFYPHFHARAIACLISSQVILIVVIALKKSIAPAIVLVPLPLITLLINFHYIYDRYNAVFKRVALDDATRKDKEDAQNPDYNPRNFLEGAYLHPSLQGYKKGDVEGGDGKQTDGSDAQLMVEEGAPETKGVPPTVEMKGTEAQ